MEIQVIKGTKGSVGRKVDRKSPLGNPFPLTKYSRDEAIAEYRKWLWDQIRDRNMANKAFAYFLELAVELKALRDSSLGCHCKPLPCHGDGVASAVFALVPEDLHEGWDVTLKAGGNPGFFVWNVALK